MTTTSRPTQHKAFAYYGMTAVLAAGMLATSCSTAADEANPEGETSSEAELASETDTDTETETGTETETDGEGEGDGLKVDGTASTLPDGTAEEAGATVSATPNGSSNDVGSESGSSTDDAPSVSIVVDPSAGQPILNSEDATLDHDGVLSCANIELAYISHDVGDEAGVQGSISTAIDLGASSAVGGMNDMADKLTELSKSGSLVEGDSEQLEAALATCFDLGYEM